MAYILLVEDDIDLAWTLEQVFRIEGYEVSVANNGMEALDFLTLRLPDLMVTDIEMPILNGEKLSYQMVVDDCGREKIPVIIVSGYPELYRAAERIGTPYFIAKPYSLEKLLALVRLALFEQKAPSHP